MILTLLIIAVWTAAAYAGASVIVLSGVITAVVCGLDAPPLPQVARWTGWVAVGVLILLFRP